MVAMIEKANSGESNAGVSQQCFPWERQPSESVAAFARFIAYRDMGATERSLRKVAQVCSISDTLVQRWSKRWSWLKRATAYDAWMLELGDGLGKHAVLRHRTRLARFASVSLDKANETVTRLSSDKLTGTEAIALAKAGQLLGDAALGLAPVAGYGQTLAPAVVTQTSVHFGVGTPSWVERSQSEAKQNENEIVVKPSEQVIAEECRASRSGPNSGPTTGQNTVDSTIQIPAGPPAIKRLKERLIEAPKRRAD